MIMFRATLPLRSKLSLVSAAFKLRLKVKLLQSLPEFYPTTVHLLDRLLELPS